MQPRLLCALALACTGSPALAKNVLLTNDDGLTSNVRALYDALKAEGHDVIVVVPCSGQSGMGAAIKFLRPLGPLSADCLNRAATKGDPGAGPMTRPGYGPDYHYVDGTPVMATLYGLDVLAMARWGGAPDVLLSGPNEGQNVGTMIVSSGTVSNAQYGLSRGVPSIALSAGGDTADNAGLANPASAKVAKLTIALLRALEANAKGGRLLQAGVALNVNFPDRLDNVRWRATRIGTYEKYKISFVADLGKAPGAAGYGLDKAALPGIALGFNTAPPAPDQLNDETVVFQTDVAVSPMQLGYQPAPAASGWLRARLRGLPAR